MGFVTLSRSICVPLSLCNHVGLQRLDVILESTVL